jgi:hypothetical protein
MFAIAIRETRIFLRQKLDYITYYYYFRRIERPVADELLKSIVKRDWVGANTIVSRIVDKGSILALKGGICPNCKEVRTDGKYCPECGCQLIIVCDKCGSSFLSEGQVKAPKFCAVCGKKILIP